MIPHMTMFCGQKHPIFLVNNTSLCGLYKIFGGVFDHETWSCGVSFPTNIMGLSMFTRVLDHPEAQGRRSNFFQKTLLFQFHWNLFWHPMMLQNIGVYVISPDEFIFYKVASEWLWKMRKDVGNRKPLIYGLVLFSATRGCYQLHSAAGKLRKVKSVQAT